MPGCVPDVFAAAVQADPSRPLLTYYDDATGERVELSGATLDNWVAKTANLLVDGHGLGATDTAVVRLPAHWQTAAVLLGCWFAGVGVSHADPADIGFATVDAAPLDAPDVYLLGFAPFGAPLRAVPAGGLDYVTEVRGYSDRFTPAVAPHTVALADEPPVTHHELVARVTARAHELGIGQGDRVLFDAARTPDPVDWLLVPLAAGASIVLCTHLDRANLAHRLAAERVNRNLS